VVGLLGSLFGILAVIASTSGPTTLNDGTTLDAQANMVPSLVFLLIYAFVFLALIAGGKHFRRERVG
jgi:hypothetical protein